MKGNRAALLAAVIGGLFTIGCGRSAGGLNLLEAFDSAEKRPAPSLFSIENVTLKDDTKPAIVIAPSFGTRLTWKVRVPDDGWLRVWLGLKPESWEQDGNGVLFMVGVSDGRAFDQLFTHHVNPREHAADRRWIQVMADLSAYGGEEVELIFNAYPSPQGQEPDTRNDFALWGAPEIVVR